MDAQPRGEALRQVHLEHVARRDVLDGATDGGLIALTRKAAGQRRIRRAVFGSGAYVRRSPVGVQ
jgi:hypothetical protein